MQEEPSEGTLLGLQTQDFPPEASLQGGLLIQGIPPEEPAADVHFSPEGSLQGGLLAQGIPLEEPAPDVASAEDAVAALLANVPPSQVLAKLFNSLYPQKACVQRVPPPVVLVMLESRSCELVPVPTWHMQRALRLLCRPL